MKVIFSRKGFDSSNGGCASPILSDGTLLSLPIPGSSDTNYSDISFKNAPYSNIIEKLSGKECAGESCHLDPDIRNDIRCNPINDWIPAFGQTGSAQGQLNNAGVEPGDIFLFFGWFRGVDEDYQYIKYSKKNADNDFYRYADLHVVYGYMQIGKIITEPSEIKKFYWHPHSRDGYDKNNTLYIPSDRLIINGEDCGPGYSTLKFDKKRVLTKEGDSRSNWNMKDFLAPSAGYVYGNKKNSAKTDDTLYYKGIWQELIINESTELLDWVKNILKQ